MNYQFAKSEDGVTSWNLQQFAEEFDLEGVLFQESSTGTGRPVFSFSNVDAGFKCTATGKPETVIEKPLFFYLRVSKDGTEDHTSFWFSNAEYKTEAEKMETAKGKLMKDAEGKFYVETDKSKF